MKGIILAGGTGSRLMPITLYLNKHLFPVYDRPMILFPLEAMKRSGIRDILVVTDKHRGEKIIEFLGSGEDFDVSLTYRFQSEPNGIGNAIKLCESYVNGHNMLVMLGDNIVFDDITDDIKTFANGSKVFLKKVDDASRFGVPIFDDHNRIINIIEKPKPPPNNFAVTGIYLFDQSVFEKANRCNPSDRGELEIADILRYYASENLLKYRILEKIWIDAGTFESLFQASSFVRELERVENSSET